MTSRCGLAYGARMSDLRSGSRASWGGTAQNGPMRPPVLASVGSMLLAGVVAVAVVVVGGTLGAAHAQPSARPPDAWGLGLALASVLSLALLRRWPVAVVWLTVALTLAYLALGYPYGPVFAPVAIAVFAAMVRGRRSAAAAATVVMAAGVVALRVPVRGEPWSWALVAGTLTWAALLLFAAENVRQRRERFVALRRERAERAGRQASEERMRLAQELHDTVAHRMALINVQAGVALHLADRKPEQAVTALAAIRDASKEGLGELRSLVDMLRRDDGAAPRRPTATLAALEELVAQTRLAGLDVRTNVDDTRTPEPPAPGGPADAAAAALDERAGPPHAPLGPLPTALDLAAYRIVQESLTNVVRHAGARRAEVRVERRPENLLVRVDDDGHGGPVPEDTEGSGLQGMRERAARLGGTLEVTASPLGGWRVTASLPLPASRSVSQEEVAR